MTPEYLISIRKALGFTQDEMSGWIGLSKRAYSDLETGKTPVRGIHVHAAERVALAVAVQSNDPMMAPASVRKEAIELARMITG